MRDEIKEQEVERIKDLVDELLTFIKDNRVPVMADMASNAPCDVVSPDELFKSLEAVEDAAKARDEGVREIIPEPRARLARELFKMLPQRMIDEGVELFEGHCVSERHGWFMIQGEAKKVEDPEFFYVIDPASVGVLGLGDRTSDILLLLPWSALHRAYVGKHIEL